MSEPLTDEEYMRELYTRFRTDIMSNNNTEFYDEEELLDIYDYAQDEGDDMVQLFVLQTGARLYPDSHFLDERRAFFLSTINDTAARTLFDRKDRRNSDLWAVLDLALKNYPAGNPEEDLVELLSSDLRFSCEAIIRLIEIIHELGRDDLIAENVEVIADRTEFKQLLYSEVANTLLQNEDYVVTAKVLADDLTKNEPFNPDNWVLLARAEYAGQNYADAATAAEYALAITPEAINARLIHGLALTSILDRMAEGVEDLTAVLKADPANAIAIKALSETYTHLGKNGAAIEVLVDFMKADSANAFVILDIMRLHPTDPTPYLKIFATQTGTAEEKWIELAGQLVNEAELDAAIYVLEYYNEHFKLTEGMEYYMRLIYQAGQYHRMLEVFEWIVDNTRKSGNDYIYLSPFCHMLIASASMLTGNYMDAIDICDTLLNHMPHLTDFGDIMRWRGLTLSINFIRYLSSHPDKIDPTTHRDPIFHPIPSEFIATGKLSDTYK